MRKHLLPLAAALTAACGSPAPPPEPEDLAPAADSIATPFTDVTDAVWLGERRWAVLAPGHSAVRVADFARGTLEPLAGAGADAIRQPYAIFRAQDSLHVADWEARALTTWGLDGSAGSRLELPSATRGTLPSARDGQGRYYAELRPEVGADGSGAGDSTLILRLRDGGADTVGALAPVALAQVETDRGRRFEARVFAGRDAWGVNPDGSLWIARIGQSRVDFVAVDGGGRRGPPLPDPVLQVTQLDRDLFVESHPPEMRRSAERLPFAELKPPFERAFADVAGKIWLEKSRSVGDSTRSYQLLDAEGGLARIIRVDGFGRVRGAGPERALVTRFADGRMVLFEQALPAATPRPASN
jgi:hypothetical protein